MTFVTRLHLASGDQAVLDRVVDDIRSRAERKGVELKGPHSHPPAKKAVPLYRRSPPDGERFGRWRYTVYRREIEIVGHESFARSMTEREYPDSVRIEVEIDQRAGMGR